MALSEAQISEDALDDFWYENYVSKGHCGLCGNHGVIDTRGVKTPAGFECGGRFFCICPNGRALADTGRAALGEKDSE